MPVDVETTEGRLPVGAPVGAPERVPAAADLAPPLTWRHAALWVCLAIVSVLAVLVVLDNFVLVELRLPGAAVRARLGWVVVTSVGAGFLAGWIVGRTGRRSSRITHSDPDQPGSA
jgi:hypothetical protein